MRKLVLVFLCSSVIFSVVGFDMMNDSGQAGYCGSPGESMCNFCHSGTAVNGGGGSIVISGAPLSYIPGQTYSLSVTVTQAGRSLFGFAIEALTTTNINAGTFVITNSTQTQILTATNSRKCVTHKLGGGASPNSHTFSFNWNAPMTNVGSVRFWATGNAANGNAASSGDLIYSSNQIVPVGIRDLSQANIELSIQPNPVTDKFCVLYSLPYATTVNASLYSITGEKQADLFSETQSSGKQQKNLSIPTGLSSGIYFIELLIDGKRTVKKIMVE